MLTKSPGQLTIILAAQWVLLINHPSDFGPAFLSHPSSSKHLTRSATGICPKQKRWSHKAVTQRSRQTGNLVPNQPQRPEACWGFAGQAVFWQPKASGGA